MNIRYLEQDWQIVVVAASCAVADLRATLAELSGKSLGADIHVMASDRDDLRAFFGETDYPVAFGLPDTLQPGHYWSTVLAHLDCSRQRTILIQAGVHVPDKWDARLAAVGQRAQGAWAVAPLCAKHPLLSAFYDAGHSPGLPVEAVDQWLNDYVEGTEFEVPVMLESCLLLQGPAWKQLGGAENDRQLMERIRLQGGWLLATDQVYIDDSALPGDSDISWLPQAYLNAFRGRHPLTATRHALMELSGRHEAPRVMRACLPVQLHIGHSWGGGLGRWMEDFIAADTDHNHLVLRSIGDLSAFGQKIALYHSTEMGVPVRSWTLSEPIMSIAQSSYEYSRLLHEIVDDYGVESLVVSSLIGHSLDLLRSALPTTFVLHDFFPFCPALYATFGSSCQSCTAGELRECAVRNPLHSFFRFETDVHWLAVRASFVELLASDAICAIAPTQSVADRYRQLEPRLREKTIHIVPHGLDQQLSTSLKSVSLRRTVDGERLRLVVLGRLTAEKGGDLLAEIIGSISAFADVWLLGAGESGERFENLPCVTVVSSYHKTELAELLQQVNPDLGLLLSIVPETFSYTLSELWAAGIPVLATRLGAFSDRIVDGGNGWLSDIQPRAVLDKLRWLDGNRVEIDRVGDALRRQEIRSAEAMTADYSALESVPARLPLARFHLPRRSYQNPYARKREEQKNGREVQALHVDHQLPYRQVLGEFLTYSAGKMQQTPRIAGVVRRGSSRFLRFLAGLVAPR